MGALCSLLLLVVMLTYTGYKISILEGKKSIDIVQAVKENHFDSSDVFSYNQGLNVAVAVLNPFDPITHQHIDPSYGEIRITRTSWGQDENGEFFISRPVLKSH